MIVSFLPHWVAMITTPSALLWCIAAGSLERPCACLNARSCEVLGRHNLPHSERLEKVKQDHPGGDEFGKEWVICGATSFAQQNLPRPLTEGFPVQTCGCKQNAVLLLCDPRLRYARPRGPAL